MLVVTRKLHEGVHIGDCHVQVCRLDGSKVRLGIDAPASVRILRDELPFQEPIIAEGMSFDELVAATLEPGFRSNPDRVYDALSVAMSALTDCHEFLHQLQVTGRLARKEPV